jgi:hypothetical protein
MTERITKYHRIKSFYNCLVPLLFVVIPKDCAQIKKYLYFCTKLKQL